MSARPKLTISQKYDPLWNAGKSVTTQYPKIGYMITLHCVTKMKEEISKDPNVSQEEKNKVIEKLKELKQYKESLPKEYLECTAEEYISFLEDFYKKVDYEDRKKTITLKTAQKFRTLSEFIDILAKYGPIPEDYQKKRKYCLWKTVNITKSLKKGEKPHRGGPHENLEEPENNEEEELNKELDQLNSNQNINNQNNNFNNNSLNINQGYDNVNLDNNFGNFNPNNQRQFNASSNNTFQQNSSFNNPFQQNENSKQDFNYNQKPNFNSPFNNRSFNASQNNFNNQKNIKNTSQKKQVDYNQYHLEDFSEDTRKNKDNIFQMIELLKERKQMLTGKNESELKPAGIRVPKVVKGKNNKMLFNLYGDEKREFPVPIKYKGIDYYVLVQHIKKNNSEAVKLLKRHRNDYTLNMVEDSLEFLSYIQK